MIRALLYWIACGLAALVIGLALAGCETVPVRYTPIRIPNVDPAYIDRIVWLQPGAMAQTCGEVNNGVMLRGCQERVGAKWTFLDARLRSGAPFSQMVYSNGHWWSLTLLNVQEVRDCTIKHEYFIHYLHPERKDDPKAHDIDCGDGTRVLPIMERQR